jgi:hypothetical protein
MRARRDDQPELIVDDYIEQRRVHIQRAIVVLDEAQLAKFIHEEVDSRPRRPNSSRQYLLIDVRNDWVQLGVLAEVGKQQEHPS